MSSEKKFAALNILLVEDEPVFSDPLSRQLSRRLEQNALGSPIVTVAGSLDEAERLMRRLPFSAIQVDLRIPKSKGGVVDGNPAGLNSAMLAEVLLPMSLKVLWSNYASVHPIAAQLSGKFDLPYWSKGTAPLDIEPELPHYTAKNGAEAFARMLALWPCPELKKGEVSWAARFFSRGRNYFPEQLSVSCGHLIEAISANTVAKAQVSFPAIFEFSEWIQRWLWAVAAGVIRSGGMLGKSPPWLNAVPGRGMTWIGFEERLEAMLSTWSSSTLARQNPLCLRFLNCYEQPLGTLNIIEALQWVRKRRNDWAHNGSIAGAMEELEDLSTPFRVVMQAASFLAAWPLVTEVESVGNLWRLTCVRGQYPWPKQELELKLPKEFRAQLGHVYQLWPNDDGSIGLLDLWPWIECRSDEGLRRQRLWLALGPHDGRQIFECSFNELRDIRFLHNQSLTPYKSMHANRWDELTKMGPKSSK